MGLLISNIFKNIASFYCLKSFPILNTIIGLHGSLLIFAIACSLGKFLINYIYYVLYTIVMYTMYLQVLSTYGHFSKKPVVRPWTIFAQMQATALKKELKNDTFFPYLNYRFLFCINIYMKLQ